MKAFWAIIKLTFKNAIRSHIFQLLLFVLALCVVFIPTTISGDGTAHGFIQISLKYSMAAVAFVLSLSSIWLGCQILSRDVENYELHMVVSKPTSRITVWLSKWISICIIHLVLLFVAAAVVYFSVIWQYNRRDFSEVEKMRIDNEVLVGRRVFMPELPDIDKLAKMLLKKQQARANELGLDFDAKKEFRACKIKVSSSFAEILTGQLRTWQYKNLPVEEKRPLYISYRFYVNKVDSSKQRLAHGVWGYGQPKFIEEKAEDGKVPKKKFLGFDLLMETQPRQFMAGVFNEITLPPGLISPDGEVRVNFVNTDIKKAPFFTQKADGPKLLLKVTSFGENYFRAIVVLSLQLIILAGLGCAAAAVLSMPTAVFVVMSYLLFGSVATYMVGNTYMSGAGDFIAYWVGRILLLGVIPMQKFEVTNYVANGELIELTMMGKLFLQYFVLRALPFFVLGMWLYKRRELGLVIRK
jgi:ABC-2 family transporter protein